jgi:hypothetical protein
MGMSNFAPVPVTSPIESGGRKETFPTSPSSAALYQLVILHRGAYVVFLLYSIKAKVVRIYNCSNLHQEHDSSRDRLPPFPFPFLFFVGTCGNVTVKRRPLNLESKPGFWFLQSK